MNIDDINAMWSEDCNIDRNKLTEESLRTPNLHAKYLSLLMQYKQRHIKYTVEYNDLRSLKFRYYRGELDKDTLEEHGWQQYQGSRPLKGDMDQILEGDSDLGKINLRISYCTSIIHQLESIMGAIKARDWQIRNAIENNKFIAGA